MIAASLTNYQYYTPQLDSVSGLPCGDLGHGIKVHQVFKILDQELKEPLLWLQKIAEWGFFTPRIVRISYFLLGSLPALTLLFQLFSNDRHWC